MDRGRGTTEPLNQASEPGTPGTRNPGTDEVLAQSLLQARTMAGVRDHTQLDAWKLSDQLRSEIYRLTRLRAFRTAPDLARQVTNAAESACANIAEGFSRYLPNDFARFLRISRGSLSEVVEHLTAGTRRELLTELEIAPALSLARRARGASTRLIRYLESATAPGRD
jgi:four helix bundle protein